MTDIILSMNIETEKKTKRTPKTTKTHKVISTHESVETKNDDDELIEDVPKKSKRKIKSMSEPIHEVIEPIVESVVEPVVEVVEPDVVDEVVESEVVIPKKRGRKPKDKVEKEKKPRGRPKLDKWKDIESKIRKGDFNQKSDLVIYISRILTSNNEYREQIGLLLKELGHNEIMMVFSFL